MKGNCPLACFLIIAWSIACNQSAPSLDIQGHRGARGHLPENTIPGFFLAIEQGATTLELDVALSADTQLIISHEPWLSAEICLDRKGNRLPENAPVAYNLFELTAKKIQEFDCGSLAPTAFPDQQSMSLPKPLLTELLDSLHQRAQHSESSLMPLNIEIKTRPEWDDIYYPDPEFFTDQLLHVLREKDYISFVTIQSFDIRPLQYLQRLVPQLPISLLVDAKEDPIEKMKALGSKPMILSPHQSHVDPQLVQHCQQYGILLIPWTVNDPVRMQELIDYGVSGIITDYPDRLYEVVHNAY